MSQVNIYSLQYKFFNRHLTPETMTRLTYHWCKRLNIHVDPNVIGYMADKICFIEQYCHGRLATSIDAMLLRTLVAKSIPSDDFSLLEIGALYGMSTLSIYELTHLHRSKMTCVLMDPLDGYYGEQKLDARTGEVISRRMLDRNIAKMHAAEDFKVIQLLSTDDKARKQAAEHLYDLFVIDGDHSYDGVKYDYEYYHDLVKPGGFIIFDDYGRESWPDVKRFVDELRSIDSGLDYLGADWHTAIFKKKQP